MNIAIIRMGCFFKPCPNPRIGYQSLNGTPHGLRNGYSPHGQFPKEFVHIFYSSNAIETDFRQDFLCFPNIPITGRLFFSRPRVKEWSQLGIWIWWEGTLQPYFFPFNPWINGLYITFCLRFSFTILLHICCFQFKQCFVEDNTQHIFINMLIQDTIVWLVGLTIRELNPCSSQLSSYEVLSLYMKFFSLLINVDHNGSMAICSQKVYQVFRCVI